MAILTLAAVVALAAEWTTRQASATKRALPTAPSDIDEFLAPTRPNRETAASGPRLTHDPLSPRGSGPSASAVAPSSGGSTVRQGRKGGALTAILVVDGRPIAVVDEAVVGIGDRLPGGARVEAIGSDRVTIVAPNGQRSVLTLTAGRQQ